MAVEVANENITIYPIILLQEIGSIVEMQPNSGSKILTNVKPKNMSINQPFVLGHPPIFNRIYTIITKLKKWGISPRNNAVIPLYLSRNLWVNSILSLLYSPNWIMNTS